MANASELTEVEVERLIPYARNAKKHPAEQIEKLKNSIKEFGFVSPVLVDKDFNIIAGHGRVLAAQELGLEKVPAVFIEGLTDEQRRAYILVDNKLTELGGWDMDVLDEELKALASSYDMEDFGFAVDLEGADLSGFFVENEPEKPPVLDNMPVDGETVTCPFCGMSFEDDGSGDYDAD